MDDPNGNSNEEKGGVLIKLDGSFGLRDRSWLTIITKDTVDGTKEETFVFPTVIIDTRMLCGAMKAGFIKGFKIVQEDPKPIVGFGAEETV